MNLFWFIVLIAVAVIVAIQVIKLLLNLLLLAIIGIFYGIKYLWEQITKTEAK